MPSSVALRETTYLPVIDERGDTAGHVRIRDRRGELGNLAAGHYTLLVLVGGAALARHEFRVDPGNRTRLELAVESGVPATIALRRGGRPLPKLVAVELAAADGRVLLDTRCSVLDAGRLYTRPFGLRPGAYRARVRDPGTRALLGERSFAVEPGATSCAVEVTIPGR